MGYNTKLFKKIIFILTGLVNFLYQFKGILGRQPCFSRWRRYFSPDFWGVLFLTLGDHPQQNHHTFFLELSMPRLSSQFDCTIDVFHIASRAAHIYHSWGRYSKITWVFRGSRATLWLILCKWRHVKYVYRGISYWFAPVARSTNWAKNGNDVTWNS